VAGLRAALPARAVAPRTVVPRAAMSVASTSGQEERAALPVRIAAPVLQMASGEPPRRRQPPARPRLRSPAPGPAALGEAPGWGRRS